VTYDYVSATGTLSAPACPADPELLACLHDDMARLIASTHPSQVLLDFGPVPAHGRDRRCTAAGVTVADATASVVRELALLARGLDPDLGLIVSARALGEPSILARVPGNVVLLVPGGMGAAEAAWARRGRAVILLDDAPGPGSALLAAGAVSLAGDGCIGALAVLRPGRTPGVEDEVAVAYWRGGAD
jgi:hypothetical protein